MARAPTYGDHYDTLRAWRGCTGRAGPQHLLSQVQGNPGRDPEFQLPCSYGRDRDTAQASIKLLGKPLTRQFNTFKVRERGPSMDCGPQFGMLQRLPLTSQKSHRVT